MKALIKKQKKRENKAITLIALIITIVILLILAGIAIASLTGENGLFVRARQAREETLEAQDLEKVKLAVLESQIGDNGYMDLNQGDLQEAINGQFEGRDVVVSDNSNGTFTVICNDTHRAYDIDQNGNVTYGVDWEYVMANAKAPSEQNTKDVIALGTSGNAVNIDLWEYCLTNQGTYALNTKENLTEEETENRNRGFKGKIIDGRIEGDIPQYISVNNGKDFIKVTSLKDTFKGIENLVYMPDIPDTITDMQGSFYGCTSLKELSKLPLSLENMQGTFNGCSSIEYPPAIPSKVVNMRSTFSGCTNLKEMPKIPYGVENMYATFYECKMLKTTTSIPMSVTNMETTFADCIGLETAPTIPNSVTNLIHTFANCENLRGTLEINANVQNNIIYSDSENMELSDIYECLKGATTNSGITLKITGTCNILTDILNTKTAGNSNIYI